MSNKVIPFIKSSSKASIPSLYSQGPKKSADGNILDHGTLGDDLKYEIYDRGVIHIFDKDLRFKKDIHIFEDAIKGLNFNILCEGNQYVISGSGDNDNLVFIKENGDIKITLRKRDFEAIGLLQSILKKGKKLVGGIK